MESLQYNTAIAITGAIRSTSSEKLYQEWGLELLRSRKWLRKLCLFYKTYKNKSPSYLYNLIHDRVTFYSTWSSQINNISNIKTRSNFFRNSFFPSTITEWNKLGCDIRISDSLNAFKLSLSKFARPVANSVFDINNPYGLKLLRRLGLGLSHLHYHKFRHNFQDCFNAICAYDLEIETTAHFLLHCPLFQSARQFLLINIKKIDEHILKHCTKNKFSIKDCFSKCDQICRKLRIWSHLLKKSLMENFIFCAVKKHDKLITKSPLYGDDKFDLS